MSKEPRHVILRGKPGSGRRTIARALFQYAPELGRRSVFTLDAGEVVSALYEPLDTGELFRTLTMFGTKHKGALVLIEAPELITDGIEKHELRRLTRFLRALAQDHDIRCIVIADDLQTAQLTTSSPALSTLFTIVDVKSPTDEIVANILHAEYDSQALVREAIALTHRFFPHRGLPGGAQLLLRDASAVATQRHKPLDIDHLHTVVSEQRGIPLSAVGARDLKELTTLSERLSERVIGQTHAVETVSRVISRSFVGLTERDRPIANFLFLGPSGVGKTELAKSLAEILYRSPRAFARIDMSEFSEAHTVQRLIGAPPGYIGYEEGGQLTNPVAAEPYSLVLLDEIEKAHPKVFDVFLQLLDDGRLTDGRGTTVDFRHTIVVATSNVGLAEIVEAAKSGEINDRELFLNRTLFPLLVEYFRPEFLNRFDAIIVFPPLSMNDLVRIGRMQANNLRKRLAAQDIELTVLDETLNQLAKRAYHPTFGARPMRRLVQDEIETPIAQSLIHGQLKQGGSLTV